MRAWESYLAKLSAFANGVPQKRWYHLTKEWIEEHHLEHSRYLELKTVDEEKAEKYRLTGWKEISFRPHDLRHTFITVCRDKGIDIHIVMNWVGHASERMILEIYDHPTDEREKNAISIMDS